jgi:hypothetical protein
MDSNANNETARPADRAPGAPNAARRGFLKGTSLALPAVVSLHSGTALANTSLGCGGMGNLPQNYSKVCEDSYSPPPDNRMRKPVKCYRKLTKSGSKWSVVNEPAGTNPAYYFRGITPGVAGKCWRKVSDGTRITNRGELAALTRARVGHSSIRNVANFDCGVTKYAIVHVSMHDGHIVAVGEPCGTTVPGAIVTSWTGACMASLYGHKGV